MQYNKLFIKKLNKTREKQCDLNRKKSIFCFENLLMKK